MVGKIFIPEGYLTMHQAIETVCEGVSENANWQEKFLVPLREAIAAGKKEITVRVNLRLFDFTNPKFFKDVKFNVADFFIPEDRDDTLGIKNNAALLKKFEFVIFDGVIRKPADYIDWRDLSDEVGPAINLLGYENRIFGARVFLRAIGHALMDNIRDQAAKNEVKQVKLPEYIPVFGQAFKTSEIGAFRCRASEEGGKSRALFCIPQSDIPKVKDICREKPSDDWVVPITEEKTSPDCAPAILNIAYKTVTPVIAAIKAGYSKWVIANARAIDHGVTPPTHFTAEFRLENKIGFELFSLQIPAESCATFINPGNTHHKDFYLTRSMLQTAVSPEISLGWKLSHNSGEQKQPMHNIKQIREIAVAKLMKDSHPGLAEKVADVVAFLAHEVTGKVLAHKPANGEEIEFRGQSININEFSFVKVTRFYRFNLSDKAIDQLVEIARDMGPQKASEKLRQASTAPNSAAIEFAK